MLKKTIKYKDFDGNEREEDFYFNLTTAELSDWELSITGGLSTLVDKLMQEQDASKIVPIFKEMIERAYGEKSPDGRRFMKSQEIFANFAATQAYSDLFMELATNAESASAFVNGILPAELKA